MPALGAAFADSGLRCEHAVHRARGTVVRPFVQQLRVHLRRREVQKPWLMQHGEDGLPLGHGERTRTRAHAWRTRRRRLRVSVAI